MSGPFCIAAGTGGIGWGERVCLRRTNRSRSEERNVTMLYYLIVCRSLTYAQRTAEVLERGGVPARVLRSPKQIAGEGCSHSVKIAQRHLSEARCLLYQADLMPKRVFAREQEGVYREVTL